MTRPVSLETASSVALIARQLGAVVSNEQIGEEYTSGGCRDETALTDYFSRYDVSVYFKKLKKTDLEKKQFLYPCVLINRDGSSSVLIGLQSEQGTGKKSFKVMDSSRIRHRRNMYWKSRVRPDIPIHKKDPPQNGCATCLVLYRPARSITLCLTPMAGN